MLVYEEYKKLNYAQTLLAISITIGIFVLSYFLPTFIFIDIDIEEYQTVTTSCTTQGSYPYEEECEDIYSYSELNNVLDTEVYGYVNFSILNSGNCPSNSEQINLGKYKFHAGCKCNKEYFQNESFINLIEKYTCENDICNTTCTNTLKNIYKCTNIDRIYSKDIISFKNNIICAKYISFGKYGNLLKTSANQTSNCSDGYKKCGTMDTNFNYLCIKSNENCPINLIEFIYNNTNTNTTSNGNYNNINNYNVNISYFIDTNMDNITVKSYTNYPNKSIISKLGLIYDTTFILESQLKDHREESLYNPNNLSFSEINTKLNNQTKYDFFTSINILNEMQNKYNDSLNYTKLKYENITFAYINFSPINSKFKINGKCIDSLMVITGLRKFNNYDFVVNKTAIYNEIVIWIVFIHIFILLLMFLQKIKEIDRVIIIFNINDTISIIFFLITFIMSFLSYRSLKDFNSDIDNYCHYLDKYLYAMSDNYKYTKIIYKLSIIGIGIFLIDLPIYPVHKYIMSKIQKHHILKNKKIDENDYLKEQ